MSDSLPKQIPPDFLSALTHLTSLDKLSIEDMKLMILLETAGEPLYEKLASLAPDGEAQKLLRMNGREELAHAKRLAKAIEILTGKPFELPSLDENPYAEPPPFGEISAELLTGVIAGEDSGNEAYQKYADNEPNAEVAELLRQNGREETRHGQRVGRVIEILQA